MARPSRIRNTCKFLILTFASLVLFLVAFAGFAYLLVTSDYVRAHMEGHATAASAEGTHGATAG